MNPGLADLGLIVQGRILVRDDESYEDARQVWNAMIDKHPIAISQCLNANDIVETVKYARSENLPISVRGGGHNVAGHAVCDDGIMIDLSEMRQVTVDLSAQCAWVEGGALWRDVDEATQAHGLATPGGLISDTGVAGLTLSGGIGWLRSKYGLCIDNLLSIEIVTADGRLLQASNNENPDLFWALRGGGGNFGVVTRFQFKLHPVGPTVMAVDVIL